MGTPQEASDMEKSLISTVTNVIAETTDVPTELRHQSEGNPNDGHTTLTLQSLPAGAIRKHPHPDNFNVSIDQIKSENHQLRRKMQYMESLGIIVTNLKQESLTLKGENVKLRRQIEEMNHNLVSCKLESNNNQKLDEKVCDSDDIVQSHDESNQSTSSSGAQSSSQSENAPSLLDSTSGDASVLNHVTRKTQNPELGPEENELLTSLISSVSSNHGNSETHQERAASTDMGGTDNPPNEARLLSLQIRQVEEMVGITSSHGNSVCHSGDETSVTSQFTKLAAVFARLAQRVVTSQRKVRTSQAFCNALMVDNDKTKNLLKQTQEKLVQFEKENERLKTANQCSKVNDLPQEDIQGGHEADSNFIQKLQMRIRKLEAQRTEILRVNKQWDSQYRRLKQEHEKTTNDVSNDATRNKQRELKRRRDIELLLATAKREIRCVTQEKSSLVRRFETAHAQCVSLKLDVTKLKENNRKLETDNSCLDAENVRLQQALEAAYSIRHRMWESINSGPLTTPNNPNNFELPPNQPSPRGGSSDIAVQNARNADLEGSEVATLEELQTRVEVLQQQVKIYREDFETERRDREKNQGEKQRLDELLTEARHQVNALTQQVRTYEEDFKHEKQEKEKLQRQLRQWQVTSRDQNRFMNNGIAAARGSNDPPAYCRDSDYVNPRRRQRGIPPQYTPGEDVLSYPPRQWEASSD